MQKRRISLLIGSVLLLTACEQTEVVTKNDVIDVAFVSTVREEIDLPFISHDELIQIGRSSCKTEDLFEAVEIVSREDIDDSDAAYIVGAAWAAYCPENTNKYK